MSEQYNANCISYWWKVADLERIVNALVDATSFDPWKVKSRESAILEWEILQLKEKEKKNMGAVRKKQKFIVIFFDIFSWFKWIKKKNL